MKLEELICKYEGFNKKRNVVSIEHFEKEARKMSVSMTAPSSWFKCFLPYIKKITDTKKALDVGCGLGHHTAKLLLFFDDVYGIDFCEYKVNRAKKQFKEVNFEVHNILNPFPVNQIDFVQMVTVLQHINIVGKCKLLFNIYNCLSDDGILLMQEGRIVNDIEDELSKRQNHMFATPVSLLKDIFNNVEHIGGTIWRCKK